MCENTHYSVIFLTDNHLHTQVKIMSQPNNIITSSHSNIQLGNHYTQAALYCNTKSTKAHHTLHIL